MEQQVHKFENPLNREFYADKPNTKWAADISYIQTGQNLLSLTMIQDLYDNSIVAYKTATLRQARELIDAFIQFYNHERIQLKTGVVPLSQHHSA